MGELVIRGLTLEQYAAFSAEAGMLRQKWEMSEGKIDIMAEMLQILAKYHQDPRSCMDEDGKLNYHACGLIYEWHEAINNDPEMLVKYSQLSGEITRKAMYGDSETAGGETVIEGVNLDQYARACATLQGKSEAEVPAVIAELGFFTDMAHWGRVRDGFNAAMGADTSLKLATHFGELFAKYGQEHMAASTQYTVDVVTMAKEEQDDRDALQQKAFRDVAQMAATGRAGEVLSYLKTTFPDDANDNDVIEWYLDKSLDVLADAGNRDAAGALLGIRYDVRGETEPKSEWVEHELDMLF
jgi:hypothetical protein